MWKVPTETIYAVMTKGERGKTFIQCGLTDRQRAEDTLADLKNDCPEYYHYVEPMTLYIFSQMQSENKEHKELPEMITKEAYVLSKVQMVIKHYLDKDQMLNPMTLHLLMEQWSFDYDADREHRPELLKLPK